MADDDGVAIGLGVVLGLGLPLLIAAAAGGWWWNRHRVRAGVPAKLVSTLVQEASDVSAVSAVEQIELQEKEPDQPAAGGPSGAPPEESLGLTPQQMHKTL